MSTLNNVAFYITQILKKKSIHHWCDQFQGYEGRDAIAL
jgi:hypothetical protein